ncbi:ExeA family protein [Hydrogenophaga intermedia]|uniref:ExeA family protein n=1 Tax=Hydrogenophaga intermedia TaxID=65786 RepID=UPI002044654D|nr:AAA family ATPase [Hydrogenophaga intermedia]MCM3563295.1 AAA family ATPase [Hydrogenophaga intermedia]
MYAEFFGLQRDPFSIAPDPRYLFMSERHREALAHLLYGIRGGGGFVLLSGEIGAGKTTICRCFLEQVPENCKVAYIFNPKLTVGDLLRTICAEFHVEVKHEGIGPATVKDHLDPLNAYLLDSHARGERNLLIIDEAQNLTPHVLEQLRLLTNLETSERKLLQIILIGQPELRNVVARPELEQLAQRVIARYHLDALDADETRQYIQHRMQVAGLKGPLPFTPAALERIRDISRGVPRRINLLCDRALLGAYAAGQLRVEPAVVDKAAGEVFDDAPPVRPALRKPATAAVRPAAWGALGLGAVAGAVVGALVAAATMWFWLQRPAPGLPPGATAPAAAPVADGAPTNAAPAPQAVAVAAAPARRTEAPGVVPVENTGSAASAQGSARAEAELPLGWPDANDLIASEAQAWRALAPLWQAELADGDPCAQALARGLQCYRTERMTINGLRQLNRPGMLQVRLPDGSAGRLLLTALGPDSATLGHGGQRWRVTLNELGERWEGDYATLWRLPPGQTARLVDGRNGPAAAWLDERLSALQALGQLPASAATPAARLASFQQWQGIESGGPAGPITFMQANLVSGVDEPRLLPRS